MGAAAGHASAPTSGRAPSTCSSSMAAGEIKACWIICTNPVASVANRRTVIDGLEAAELVITQDAFARHRDQRLRRHRAARRAVGRVRRRDGQLRAQPDAAAAVDAAARRGAAGLAADRAGRRAMGFGEHFAYESSAEEIFDEITPVLATRGPATTCAASATSGCARPRCSGRSRPVTAPDRNPIRYLNDGVSQDLFVDDERRPAPAGVPDAVAARGVPRPAAPGRRRAARRRLPVRAQHRPAAAPVAHA